MKFRPWLGVLVLLGLAATMSLGCGEGTEVPLAEAPAIESVPTQELPKDFRQGGGPNSSGNMNRNPGASS